jgi:hypothetical protein
MDVKAIRLAAEVDPHLEVRDHLGRPQLLSPGRAVHELFT